MTSPIEILDTAIKIGLGAAITGLTTYLVTRRTHLHEVRKIRLQETTQLLRECMGKIESATTRINEVNHIIYGRRRALTEGQVADVQDCRQEFSSAFSEVKDARSICILLGLKQAAALFAEYAQKVDELSKYQMSQPQGWAVEWVNKSGTDRSELKNRILDCLAQAYQATYA